MRGGWSARAALLASGSTATRGARLIARHDGRPLPSFTALAGTPAWAGWSEPRRRRLATVAALLQHRGALARELRGEVVAPLAALTGERLFDAICALPAEAEADGVALPCPSRLAALGDNVLRDALDGCRSRETVACAVALIEADAR